MRTFFAVIFFVVLFSCKEKAPTRQATEKDKAIPVKLAAIIADTSSTDIQASGMLSPEQESRPSFKTGGVIDRVLVKEGQVIKKGQLLASLKRNEIAAQVEQVQLVNQKAQRDYQRAMNLYKDSVATLEQLENAKTGADIAQQNVHQVMFNEQYANIYAPADGFIIKKLINEGEINGPGSPCFIIGSLNTNSKWVMRLSVSDKQWVAIPGGSNAVIMIDAFPGQTFAGVVSKKSPNADPLTGSFQVEIQVNINGFKPAVGMFGTARIISSGRSVGFAIPYEALLEANGKQGFVFVSNNQKQVNKVSVDISRMDKDQVFISGGLEGYQYVVVSGSPYLKDHSIIKTVQ